MRIRSALVYGLVIGLLQLQFQAQSSTTTTTSVVVQGTVKVIAEVVRTSYVMPTKQKPWPNALTPNIWLNVIPLIKCKTLDDDNNLTNHFNHY